MRDIKKKIIMTQGFESTLKILRDLKIKIEDAQSDYSFHLVKNLKIVRNNYGNMYYHNETM